MGAWLRSKDMSLGTSSRMRKAYLGDGVYVQLDRNVLVLTAENGVDITNTIYLEPEVWRALERYVNRLETSPTGDLS